MSRVVHFEIQVDDVERAKAFYTAAFGWSYEDYSQFTGSPYWGIVTGPEDQPGINGGLLQRPAPAPAGAQGTNAFVCTMGVGDYDETERRILERRRAGGPAEDGPDRDGVAGLLPRHRGQHLRHPPARPGGGVAVAPPSRRTGWAARVRPAADAARNDRPVTSVMGRELSRRAAPLT